MFAKRVLSILASLAFVGCASLDESKVARIHTNKKFIADTISGESCVNRYFDFESSIKYISQLKDIISDEYIGGNSLTVQHDDISYRWSRLLGISFSAAATKNSAEQNEIKNLLLDFARNEKSLKTKTFAEASQGQCYEGGNTAALCAVHTPQHYAFMYSSFIISGILVKDALSDEEREELESFYSKIYHKYIRPSALRSQLDGGYYEFGAGGIGIVAYADFIDDRTILIEEFARGKKIIEQRLEPSGYIDNNSYRGVRAYFYHTLGADSMLSYALLMRSHGYDIFTDKGLGPRFERLVEKTVEGQNDYQKFISKGSRGKNLSTNLKDERRSIHGLSKNVQSIALREYGARVFSGSDLSPVNRISGFNSECLYESNPQPSK